MQDTIKEAIKSMAELKEFDLIDWFGLENVLTFLKPFHEVTEMLSGENYATISLISSCVPELIEHAKQDFLDESLEAAAAALETKLVEYSGQLRDQVIIMATFVDPRLKLSLMSAEEKLHARDTLKQNKIGSEEIDRQHNSSIFDRIFLSKTGSEVDRYLELAREQGNTNILDYWRTNSLNYPELAHLARQILPIQATSVSSERLFSRAGLIDTPLRNRLDDESLRANLTLNSWMKYLDVE